jgi:hypothetical protein
MKPLPSHARLCTRLDYLHSQTSLVRGHLDWTPPCPFFTLLLLFSALLLLLFLYTRLHFIHYFTLSPPRVCVRALSLHPSLSLSLLSLPPSLSPSPRSLLLSLSLSLHP